MENEEQLKQQPHNTTLMAELVVLHGERLTLLSERVAWGEVCFRRVEDSGVIHMAKVIKQMVNELETLKIKYNRLNMFVKAHLGEPPDEGEQQGGGSQSPAQAAQSTLPPHLRSKFGR